MLGNTAIRNLIREGKTYELHSIMQMNKNAGMQILDNALADLVTRGIVTEEEAMLKSSHRDRLKKLIEKPF
jgi:twitching motility protein PilT